MKHKILSFPSPTGPAVFDNQLKEGWVLVTVYFDDGKWNYIFRRVEDI